MLRINKILYCVKKSEFYALELSQQLNSSFVVKKTSQRPQDTDYIEPEYMEYIKPISPVNETCTGVCKLCRRTETHWAQLHAELINFTGLQTLLETKTLTGVTDQCFSGSQLGRMANVEGPEGMLVSCMVALSLCLKAIPTYISAGFLAGLLYHFH